MSKLFLRGVVSEGGNAFVAKSEPDAEYIAWMKAELDKSLARRNDPDRKVYAAEEIKARYGLL